MTKETLGLFARGDFWGGLREYAAERLAQTKNDALGATSWENVNRAKGQESEIAKMKSLQAEVENHIAAQRTA